MVTRKQVEEFINNAEISEPQRNALIRRLNGIYQDPEDELSKAQVKVIFEGMNKLFLQFENKFMNLA